MTSILYKGLRAHRRLLTKFKTSSKQHLALVVWRRREITQIHPPFSTFCFLNAIVLTAFRNKVIDFSDILVPKWKVNWKDFLQFPLSSLYGLCSEKHPSFCQAYLDTLMLCGDRIQELLIKHDYVLLLGK